MYDPNRPHGSPLSPQQDPQAPMGVMAQQAPMPQMPPEAPQGVMSAPVAPPVAPGVLAAPMTQQMPPQGVLARKKYKPFAKENRSQALLAIGTGLLSNPMSFAAGIGAAGENLGKLRSAYDELQKPDKSTIGGPDNAFQITTDRDTGEQSFKAIPAMTDYLGKKAAAAKAPKAPTAAENVAARGRLAGAVLTVDPANRAQAYSDFVADSNRLGYDLGLPPVLNEDVLRSFTEQTIDPSERAKTATAATARTTAQSNADRTYNLRVQAGSRAQGNADRSYGLRAQASSLAERKYNSPPSTRKAASVNKPPAGFILDK